jgi:hypothetical protein
MYMLWSTGIPKSKFGKSTVDMCGLTGEQDPDSDLDDVDGPWHTGKIFDTMDKRKHVSCAGDPGFFIFIERRKRGQNGGQ